MTAVLRNIAAKLIAETRPSLFYYKADAKSRQRIAVRSRGDVLDIIDTADRKTIRISRKNAVYLPDMIDSFDYFFGSAAPVKVRTKDGIYDLVDFSTPRLHHVTGFDDFAILCPSLTEPYMTTGQYLDFAAIGDGDIVLDLGSYSALTSIAFSKAVGATGKVIALEPDPLNYFAAEVNIASQRRVNNLDNIILLAAAVSDREGVLQLSSEGAMGSALTSIVGNYRGETTEVKCVSLQNIADTYLLPRVDFIKMDIEGAELSVILGSTDFIKGYQPRMIIEPHLIDGQLTSGPIMECLAGIGYSCALIAQSGLSLPLITAAPPT